MTGAVIYKPVRLHHKAVQLMKRSSGCVAPLASVRIEKTTLDT